MQAVSQELGECPCGSLSCGFGTKLTRFGHLVGCHCQACTGRRNRRKGHAAQAKMHKALGGTGFTPHDEESARPYQVECMVMPESKTGAQIPTSWDSFIATKWFKEALKQSTAAVPVGSGALPCVVLRGDFAIIDIRRKP
jgi:hypothetical protein